MKKIIALAVAGAFVAPMAFADVTISGVMDMSYHTNNDRTAADTTKDLDEDSTITVKASTELANGLSIAADFNITHDSVTSNDGNSIDISGPFGKVAIGDNAGAVDGVDTVLDYTRSVSSFTNDDAEMGGGDAGLRWDMPVFVEGLSIAITASAKDDNPGNAEDDTNGGSIKYTAGPVTVAYAREDIGSATEVSGYAGNVVVGGVQLGAEAWTSTTAAVDTDMTAIGGSYTMGDIKIAYRASKTDSANVDLSDIRTIVLNYSLGSGVTLFAESATEKVVANTENTESETAFGVEYKF